MQLKIVRFKEVPLGSKFRICIGGAYAIATKTKETEMFVPKANPRGRDVHFPIDPELNQDDCELVVY